MTAFGDEEGATCWRNGCQGIIAVADVEDCSCHINPRPLDPRKIDYRIHAHSGSSQRCEGVYPDGTTREEVERCVRGTFGGRFERFGGGTFSYIAYTD